jgi:hypothetical protein
VQFFVAGTATPSPVYSDATLTVPLANPLTLDANGEALFYTGAGVAYKVTVRDSLAALIWTEDNVIFGGGSGTSIAGSSGEWTQVSGAPTFIDATHFAYVGDQTATFDAKRRLKSTVTAGTTYSTVVSSLFAAGNTTVTVLNDAGNSLDAGLSVVQVGILDPAHPSIPNISNFFRKNFLLNGAMQVTQRIAGGVANTVVGSVQTLDRWQGRIGAAGNVNYSQVGTVGLLDGLPFALRMQRVAANNSVTPILLGQSLETNDATPLADQFATLSFWAKAGSNFSPAGGLLNASVKIGTGTDENIFLPYTGLATPLSSNFALTALWQRFQVVGLIPAGTPMEAGVQFSWTPTGVAGANDFCDVTGVQLEVSNAATDFDQRPFSETVARCQRYFQKSFAYGTAPAQNAGLAGASAGVAGKAGALAEHVLIPLSVTMRVTPTPATFNPSAANAQVRDVDAAADCSATAQSTVFGNSLMVFNATGNAGTAVGNLLAMHWTADAEL